MRRLKIFLLLAAVLPLCGFKFLSGLENEKANKLYKKGQIGKAKSAYAKALKSDPTSPEVAYNFGNALFREGLFKDSESNYQKSTAQKSENTLLKAKAFYNLGNSQYRQNQIEKAADSYKKSLRLNSKDEDAKYNLELVLKQLEKDKKNPEKDKKKDEEKKPEDKKQDQKKNQGNNEGKDGGEGDGKDPKPDSGKGEEKQDSGSGQPKEEKGSQQEQDKQQSGEGQDKEERQGSPKEGKEQEGAEKQEQEKQGEEAGQKPQEKPGEEQPKTEAQLRAEQLLGALENQEQQVLKFQNSQNGPRSRVRRVAEQDW